jgi:hypothetical protein
MLGRESGYQDFIAEMAAEARAHDWFSGVGHDATGALVREIVEGRIARQFADDSAPAKHEADVSRVVGDTLAWLAATDGPRMAM